MLPTVVFVDQSVYSDPACQGSDGAEAPGHCQGCLGHPSALGQRLMADAAVAALASAGIEGRGAASDLPACSLAAMGDVTLRCGAPAPGDVIPAACDAGCSGSFTPWWHKCEDNVDIKNVDASLSGALTTFFQRCVSGGGGGGGGGH